MALYGVQAAPSTTITNLGTTTAQGSNSLFPGPTPAQGSMPGESNEWHVALAIGAVAAIVVFTGILNAKVSIGRGAA